jgi:glycosyltransferase involved in cell wall biosynthesis
MTMDVKNALKFAEGSNGGLPPGKEDEEIDLRIAHWCLWGPRGSGLYETTRELIQAEMEIPGVLPGMCLVPSQNAAQTVKEAHIMGHYKDALHPELNPQNWGWAYKHADVHVIHFSFDKKLSDLEPKVFFAHGTPEACLGASMRPGDDSNSFEAGADWVDKFKATIVTSERAKQFWSVFDHEGGGKIHKVNKGIDLDWWQKGNTMKTLDGEPSILYGDVWRDIKHPALLFYAANEIFKEHPQMRLNMWGLAQNMALWNDFIDRSGFRRFIGQFPIGGLTDYPEHYYNRGDVLVSPVTMGDLSRVHQEAMACGCPVVAWDSDPFKDNHPYKYARAFDTSDLADKIMQAYNALLDDPVKVHAECRKIAEDNFDVRKEAKDVVAILRKVSNESKK